MSDSELQVTYDGDYSERTFQLKFKVGIGYQWLYNDGEPRSQVFQSQLEAEMWMRRENGELQHIKMS